MREDVVMRYRGRDPGSNLCPLRTAIAALAFFVSLPARAQTYSLLHAFRDAGVNPKTPLIAGSDGNFYGTTSIEDDLSKGTIFRITPGGAMTTLHSFSGNDGAGPNGLVEGTDGNFYGTTAGGGIDDGGTVFKVSPSGVLTTLHYFAGTDGLTPAATLTLGSDGNLYGTTAGNSYAVGSTIFTITTSGNLTTLYRFPLGANAHPSGLVQGSDGNFYGTTSGAGANNAVLKLAGDGTGRISVYNGSDGTVHVILDVNGYFQ